MHLCHYLAVISLLNFSQLRVYRSIIVLAALLTVSLTTVCQVQVKGKVFDMTQSIPLELVSVMSTSGTGTATDSLGRYTITARETDSIWFSYLGKSTPKYPVSTIPNLQNFEVSLHVNVTVLRPVMVKPPNYHLDSIQNRRDYAKAFDFHKPGIGVVSTPGGAVGLDLDEFIQMFQFRRNKRMAQFRDRLIQEEQDKFIEHRFSRALVIRLTGLRGLELDTFMVRYKPDLLFTQLSTDYEFQSYIKASYQKYMTLKRIRGELKKAGE